MLMQLVFSESMNDEDLNWHKREEIHGMVFSMVWYF